MHSDDNADKLVLRLRVTGVDDINDEDERRDDLHVSERTPG